MTSPHSNDAVLLDMDGKWAWITLNRPQVHNALNLEMRNGLAEAVRCAEVNPAVRVLIIRGAGQAAFSAGADIKEFRPVTDPVEARQQRIDGHWIGALDRCRKPMIAAIKGYCFGGGLEIALACDIRIASVGSSFGFPETGLGIFPAAGGTQRAARVLGLGKALDLILTGERISGEEAIKIGLITRLAATDQFDGAVRDLAERLAGNPPQAMQFAKEAVRKGYDLAFDEGRRLETDLLVHLMNTKDRLEAAEQFRKGKKDI